MTLPADSRQGLGGVQPRSIQVSLTVHDIHLAPRPWETPCGCLMLDLAIKGHSNRLESTWAAPMPWKEASAGKISM